MRNGLGIVCVEVGVVGIIEITFVGKLNKNAMHRVTPKDAKNVMEEELEQRAYRNWQNQQRYDYHGHRREGGDIFLKIEVLFRVTNSKCLTHSMPLSIQLNYRQHPSF